MILKMCSKDRVTVFVSKVTQTLIQKLKQYSFEIYMPVRSYFSTICDSNSVFQTQINTAECQLPKHLKMHMILMKTLIF